MYQSSHINDIMPSNKTDVKHDRRKNRSHRNKMQLQKYHTVSTVLNSNRGPGWLNELGSWIT